MLPAALLISLAALTGCGSDGGKGDASPAAATSARPVSGPSGANGPAAPDATAASIGELKGPDGVVVTLTSATRDKGGFVTVNGAVTNRGSKPFTPLTWRSKETAMKSQSSVSGASLIDEAGRKRYLVLRDTDGECLCTTGLVTIRPGESRPIFAQFPAPPDSVTEVGFQLPAMPSVRIKLSG
ncbi:hypothetical protein GCM10010359_16600 [Streptomyces morookaense]|uniref:Secreted protein n=2 Tax=Streptomyces TaxID=1883 RepID=A0A7Y7B2Z5_STRMO|nr:hypothetical protein [Streptomyces morookaense]GHF15848.1 hypothetical protein GCM10010359_16600 [Streptomyces morookaense]